MAFSICTTLSNYLLVISKSYQIITDGILSMIASLLVVAVADGQGEVPIHVGDLQAKLQLLRLLPL